MKTNKTRLQPQPQHQPKPRRLTTETETWGGKIVTTFASPRFIANQIRLTEGVNVRKRSNHV
jgi:hypothetical protein